MQLFTTSDGEGGLNQEAVDFYRRSLIALDAAQVPFMVGGAYALARYTGIIRHTKDFDVFVRPDDAQHTLDVLAETGCETEMTFPHWLGKAYNGEYYIDVIFSAGNGVATVDDIWFEYAVNETLMELPVKLIPTEEMIRSKGFILERERCDIADVAHLLRANADKIDWGRLLHRFADNWRVLAAHLVLFGFIYPGERTRVPQWVMDAIVGRLKSEMQAPPATGKVCYGTLISRAQYLIDIEEWGYEDARLLPQNKMTERDVAHWTAAIEDEE
jgi:hypothetical protein